MRVLNGNRFQIYNVIYLLTSAHKFLKISLHWSFRPTPLHPLLEMWMEKEGIFYFELKVTILFCFHSDMTRIINQNRSESRIRINKMKSPSFKHHKQLTETIGFHFLFLHFTTFIFRTKQNDNNAFNLDVSCMNRESGSSEVNLIGDIYI